MIPARESTSRPRAGLLAGAAISVLGLAQHHHLRRLATAAPIASLPRSAAPRSNRPCGHFLIGLLPQLLERGKHRAEHDFQQRRALVADFDVLLHRGKEPASVTLTEYMPAGIEEVEKRPRSLVSNSIWRCAEQLLGADQHGRAHLRGAGRIENHAGNFPGVGAARRAGAKSDNQHTRPNPTIARRFKTLTSAISPSPAKD